MLFVSEPAEDVTDGRQKREGLKLRVRVVGACLLLRCLANVGTCSALLAGSEVEGTLTVLGLILVLCDNFQVGHVTYVTCVTTSRWATWRIYSSSGRSSGAPRLLRGRSAAAPRALQEPATPPEGFSLAPRPILASHCSSQHLEPSPPRTHVARAPPPGRDPFTIYLPTTLTHLWHHERFHDLLFFDDRHVPYTPYRGIPHK